MRPCDADGAENLAVLALGVLHMARKIGGVMEKTKRDHGCIRAGRSFLRYSIPVACLERRYGAFGSARRVLASFV